MAKKLAQLFLTLLTLFFLSPSAALAQTPQFEFLSKSLDVVVDTAVSGNLAYVAAQEHIYILDISNPSAPREVGHFYKQGCVFYTIDVEGASSYLGQAHFSCRPENSIYVFDVSEPENLDNQTPIVIPTRAAFYEMTVQDGYLYIASGLGGLYILDVHNPSPLLEPAAVFKPDVNANIVDVKVRGNIAYLADNNGKIWTVDITNKTQPSVMDSFELPGSATGVSILGNYAFVSLQGFLPGGNGGLQVVNVEDPNYISHVGLVQIPDPQVAWDVEVSGNYAFVNDDGNKLLAFDISSPSLPALVAQYQMEDEWRLTVAGDLIFASNGAGGLSIFRFTGLAPAAPTPFLDLPWDIGQLTFERAALNPNSWFDHHYPLQNYPCCNGPVTNYTGRIINEAYRSHNGYDYGQFNGVVINTPVQAAAPGWATFVPENHSSGAGNVIKIDHENGYQTWYEHLQPGTSLVVQTEGQSVYVNRGQTIGLTGMSGNTTGAHIHFSVFKDRDGYGFEDEVPYGVTDPLGWEGSYPDPWLTDMGGAYSYNLFIARALPQSTAISSSGGTTSYGGATITIPGGASLESFNLTISNGPFEGISTLVRGIVPSIFLNAANTFGQQIYQFLLPIQFLFDYSDADLSNIDENTLQFYSFNEQSGNWDSIPTTLDTVNNIAYGETLHFSQFALMGNVKDLTPPTTEVIIEGEQGQNGWYKSDVSIQLLGEDNEDGVGFQYTLYSFDGNEWFVYENPINFTGEGTHRVTYQSFDKWESTEGSQTIEFNIDKISPEAIMFYDIEEKRIIVDGIDENQTEVFEEAGGNRFVVTDVAGNALTINGQATQGTQLDSYENFSMNYSDGLSIGPLNRKLLIYDNLDDNQEIYRYLLQRWYEDYYAKIEIVYKPITNKSTIYIKVPGQPVQKETREGLVLLQVLTDRGNLNYSY